MSDDVEKLLIIFEGAVERVYTSGNTVESVNAFNQARAALTAAFEELRRERDEARSVSNATQSLRDELIAEVHKLQSENAAMVERIEKLEAAMNPQDVREAPIVEDKLPTIKEMCGLIDFGDTTEAE